MYPFTSVPNPEAIVYKLIQYLGLDVSRNAVSEELNIHPEYPSLLSLSEVLINFKIGNTAYSISKEDLSQVTTPCVAYISKPDNEYVLITKVTNKFVFLNNGNGLSYNMERAKFDGIFKGVVLIIHDVQEETIKSTKLDLLFLKDLIKDSFALLILLFIFGLLLTSNSNYVSIFKWPLVLTAFFKTLGLITTTLLLIQGVDSNSFIQKLCDGKTINCNAILNSNAAKIFEWLSWSEVGFFYFMSTWLLLLFKSDNLSILQILAWLSLIGLPYTFYSIYYQARIAKQWCILCCTIQILLWMDFLTLFDYLKFSLVLPNLNQILWLIIFFLLPITIWYIIKPFLLNAQRISTMQMQLREFKYNKDLFNTSLKGQQNYEQPDKEWSLVLGNTNAKNIITVISNPYCGPCAKAHKDLTDLLSQNNNIQARIIFTDYTDRKNDVARDIMALKESKGNIETENALKEWYDKKNYLTWIKKYSPISNESSDKQIEMQKSWCRNTGIMATPTFLVNGHELPRVYNLTDLKYIIE